MIFERCRWTDIFSQEARCPFSPLVTRSSALAYYFYGWYSPSMFAGGATMMELTMMRNGWHGKLPGSAGLPAHLPGLLAVVIGTLQWKHIPQLHPQWSKTYTHLHRIRFYNLNHYVIKRFKEGLCKNKQFSRWLAECAVVPLQPLWSCLYVFTLAAAVSSIWNDLIYVA